MYVGNSFLDLSHDKAASEEGLHLLSVDWLGGVPQGAVGRHHGFRVQVEGVVAAFSTLWTEREKERERLVLCDKWEKKVHVNCHLSVFHYKI